MAINTSKVIVGGLAAGVVLNVIDFIANGYILGEAMRADANALSPGLGDAMAQPSGSMIAGYVIMNFLVGMLLVWTYAGFRPRFGPGVRTAMYVALIFFAFGLVLTTGYMHLGVMSSGTWITYAAIWFINLLLATTLGAKLYSEDDTPAV